MENAVSLPETSIREIRRMLETMILIRVFEERVVADYRARLIPGFTHTCIGQEAVAVGVCAALKGDDYVTSTHRGHGHAVAKGLDPNRVMAELYGKATGVCGGRGGSMHVADLSRGMLGCNGIVGGGFGLATGAALSAQLRHSGQVAICFFGDGGINKGSFHEAMNFAAVQRLPVVFVCENNQYAQYTAVSRSTSISDLSQRAIAYGVEGARVDGNDALAVYALARRAIDRARSGVGPTLVCAETYRYRGHSEGGEVARYRPEAEIEAKRLDDPIVRLEEWLLARSLVTSQERAEIWSAAAVAVEAAARFAASSPDPEADTALDFLFTPKVARRGATS